MKIAVLQRPGKFTASEFKSNLEEAIRALRGTLTASINVELSKKWPRIDLEGADSEILAEMIARNLGRAQIGVANIEVGGSYQGMVVREANGGLEVDIGIETPKLGNVKIGLPALRAQLADGKALPGHEIVQDYCLLPGSRTSVRITRLDQESGFVEGWLADSETDRLSLWVKTHLDRIHVSDCYRQEVESAIRKSHVGRDVVSLEPLTLTVHSILCKLGTDAVGLIPKLGAFLRNREMNPFIPKRILKRYRQW